MTPLLQPSGESDTYEIDQTWTGFAGKTWQVHKFGGTSVASAECYQSAAKIVEDQLGIHDENTNHTKKQELNLAVVVSAMGGKPKTTDLLLQSVEAAAKRDQEEVDKLLDFVRKKHAVCLEELFAGSSDQDYQDLLSVVETDLNNIRDILKTVALMKWQAQRISELVSGYGELWSARILSKVLHNRSVARQTDKGGDANFLDDEFVFIDARRIIVIDEEAIQNGAVEWKISEGKLGEVYKEETAKHDSGCRRLHFVITGYVASNTEGVATTLQRDGSDYSAAIMGRLLQSTNITIWTDVDGVLSADPRRVPEAHAVPEVSYNEAMELAYFGAKVIHPKTMQPAISSDPQIPIFIRNTFNASFRGTRIYTSSVTNTQSDSCVCGFSSIDKIALINVEGSGLIGVQGVAKRLFGTLEHLGINVVLISQGSSEHSITFATPIEDATRAKEAIEEEFQKELDRNRISNIDVNSPCSIVAAVGDGMKELTGVAGRFFSAMGDAQINIFAIAQGCSERNISVVVGASQSTRALRALHAAFRLSHTTVRVGIVGMNNPLGESLLRLLEVQRRRLWNSFEIDLQVCAVAMDSHDTDIFQLQKDGNDSINLGALRAAQKPSGASSRISFESQTTVGGDLELVGSSHNDLSNLLDSLVRDDCAHHVIFDCTDDVEASRFHPEWLHKGVHVVTANITGISGSKEISDEILAAEKARGKLSAQYLREVTVCGGLPVISTIRTLLNSGDKIRRVDGIVSVAMSYIMFRISPPPEFAKSGEYDKQCTNGEFQGDIISEVGTEDACSFSQAVKEAMSMDLMEKDLSLDLSNDYASSVLMVLAKELGVGQNLSHDEIRDQSETIVDLPEGGESITDHHVFEGSIDEQVKARVQAASEKGCVLRHVGSVDVKTGLLEIKIAQVPYNHVFATTPPTVECVRFFTHRFQHYPLVVQGPSAGMDCTSSALLAELLSMMRSKVGPKSGILSRSNSSAFLK